MGLDSEQILASCYVYIPSSVSKEGKIMNPQTISLTELQKHLDQTCKEKGWDKNSVTEVFLLFTEEVGELAKAVRKETGFKDEKKPDNHDNLREEFADVLNYLMELANRFDVNLAEVYFEKHKINQTRQWK